MEKLRFHKPRGMVKKKKRERERKREVSTQITNAGKDMEVKKHLNTVDGNINWHSHCGKQYGGFSKD